MKCSRLEKVKIPTSRKGREKWGTRLLSRGTRLQNFEASFLDCRAAEIWFARYAA